MVPLLVVAFGHVEEEEQEAGKKDVEGDDELVVFVVVDVWLFVSSSTRFGHE